MSLLTNIVTYYKFDGNSNDSVSTNNGTDTSVTYSNANGIINNGAGFNGSSSQVALPTGIPDLNSNTAFSFSFWVKTSTTTSQYVSTRCDTSAKAQWNIYTGNDASGVVEFEISPINSSTNRLTCYATGSVADGNFHHVVITYSGNRLVSGVTIYVDGSSKTINTVTNTLSSNAPTGTAGAIGSRTSTFGSYFNGAVDEFGIWSRALSSSEVTQLYNGGKGLQYPFSNGSAFLTFM